VIKHYLIRTWIEVGENGPIRTCWFCNCGGGGSAWGSNLKANDKKIAGLVKKHIRVQQY